MKVLITGASGFIGLAILKRLLKVENIEILAITRKLRAELPKNYNLAWVESNLDDHEKINKIINDFQPLVIIHLAWADIPNFSLETSLKNLNTSIAFFEAIFKSESCSKILVAGSCFEYNQKIGECTEGQAIFAKDSFTWSKLSLLDYLLINCASRNINLGWFRLFYVYGPRQRKESLLPTLVDYLKNKEVPKLNTPKNSNDFIYVDDVAKAFELALKKDFKSGIFNLGSGQSTSVIEFSTIVENELSNQNNLTKILTEQTKDSIKDTDFFASTSLTKKTFGWRSKISLLDGIKKTIESLDSE